MVDDPKPLAASDELTQIVQSVFQVMTGLDVSPSEASWFPSHDRLTAAVNLQGDGSKAVLIECDRAQACRMASRFLSVEPPERVEPVVSDVLGELANMIGGNLKCVMEHGADLSIPSVVDGGNDCVEPRKADILKRVAFENAGDVFWVTLLTLCN